MLAGIGGRTVAEAKARVSCVEFQAWLDYREKHGPLDCARRIEHAAALIAQTVSSTVPRSKGSKPPKLEAFFLYGSDKGTPAPDLDTAKREWR